MPSNDFSSDSNCLGWFQFESGDYLGDSKGACGDLTAPNSYTGDTSEYTEGSASVALAAASSQYLALAQSDMPSGLAFKNGTSDKTFSLIIRAYIGGQCTILAFNDGGSGGLNAYIRPTNKLRLTFYGSSSTNIDFGTAFTAGSGYNNWYDIIITYDFSDDSYRLSIYDETAAGFLGSDVTGTLSAAMGNVTSEIRVGFGASYLDGNVDELVFSSEVWGTTTIQDIIDYNYGSAGYTLTADYGSFTFTGIAADLIADRTLPASQGSFTFTGIAADLYFGRAVDAGTGSFTFTGIDTGLFADRTIDSAVGSFAFTGIDANLEFGRSLVCNAGTFTFTGIDAILYYGRMVSCGVGSFAFTGIDANLIYTPVGGYTLTCNAGTFTFTGIDTALLLGRVISCGVGSFAFTGIDALFYRGLMLSSDVSAFAFTGIDANLLFGRVLSCDPASFSFTGIDATLVLGKAMISDAGVFILTGIDTGFIYDRTISADVGSFIFTGIDAILDYSGSLSLPAFPHGKALKALSYKAIRESNIRTARKAKTWTAN